MSYKGWKESPYYKKVPYTPVPDMIYIEKDWAFIEMSGSEIEIYTFLQKNNGKANYSEILKGLKIIRSKWSSCKKVLKSLQRKGAVGRVGRGEYAIPNKNNIDSILNYQFDWKK